MGTEKKTEHYAGKVTQGASGYAVGYGGNAYFGGQVGIQAAKMSLGRAPGAPIMAAANGTAAAGPAAVVSVPAGMAGEWIGGKISEGVGFEKDGAAEVTVKTTGGLGAAAIGAFAGPGGAAAGAAVGAVGYGAGKAVGGLLWLSEGQEGHCRIKNTTNKKITCYSYNRQDSMQTVSSACMELTPDKFGDISATNGIMNFGTDCSEFYVHVYVDDICKTSGYGFRVKVNSFYEYGSDNKLRQKQ